ncbi:hypothetical protein JDS87_27650 [Bacillus cereus]|uniref:hypothetical protein n=1 Tax=Bacillus cereus TaxID=1396 RepID=UPI0018F5D59E|nr:hypothetical protein [Bacillus cereus]MBJ8055590.1 hypothetical protein [Bacillus cereus]
MEYIVCYVTPFLIIGTAIFVFITAMSLTQNIWDDLNLLFVIVGLGINILAIPVSFFIGGMSTDAPDSTMLDFYKGFLFIQGIPLIILLLTLVWWFIRWNKK